MVTSEPSLSAWRLLGASLPPLLPATCYLLLATYLTPPCLRRLLQVLQLLLLLLLLPCEFQFFIADLEFDVDSEETYAFFLPNLANALFEIGYGHNYSCCAERAYRRDDVAFLRVLGLRRIYPQLLPHTYVGCISTVV